jgi:hypothetical protein
MDGFGTKIKVLQSTLRKGIGPRKNSTGFLGQKNSTCYSDKMSTAFIAYQTFFTRYGNEQKQRCERKIAVLAIPAIKDEDKAEKCSGLLISKIKSSKNMEIFKEIKTALDVPFNTPVIAAIPDYGGDLVTCSKTEFAAWINSIFSSIDFRAVLEVTLGSKHYEKFSESYLQRSVYWHRLLEACLSRERRRQLIRHSLETESNRRRLISTIRKIVIPYRWNNLRRDVKTVINSADIFGSAGDMAARIFDIGMFNPSVTLGLEMAVAENPKEEVNSFLRSFNIIRQAWLGLS